MYNYRKLFDKLSYTLKELLVNIFNIFTYTGRINVKDKSHLLKYKSLYVMFYKLVQSYILNSN